MSFDDKEKKLDRRVNSSHIKYQKFLDKETCPTCNCNSALVVMRDTVYDKKKQKYMTRKWIHDDEKCFKWFAGLVMALKKDKDGMYIDTDIMERVIKHAYKILKGFDEKYKEKGQ